MYINTLRLTTLIIYSFRTLSIYNFTHIYAPKELTIFHHVINKSAQGEETDFEINYVILRQNQIIVCTPSPSKNRDFIWEYIDYWDNIPSGKFRQYED